MQHADLLSYHPKIGILVRYNYGCSFVRVAFKGERKDRKVFPETVDVHLNIIG